MRPHPSTHTARETAFWFFVALKELEMEERNLQKKVFHIQVAIRVFKNAKLQLHTAPTRFCNR